MLYFSFFVFKPNNGHFSIFLVPSFELIFGENEFGLAVNFIVFRFVAMWEFVK